METTENNFADTYYVYDAYYNLGVVLPPEATHQIELGNLGDVPEGYTLITSDHTITPSNYTGGSYMYTQGASITIGTGVELASDTEIVPYGLGNDFLDRWAFQYKYDGRNRMTEKRVPGAGWVYMIYDKADRLVLTQDANQRGINQWTFTKYDIFARPVSTGFYTNVNDTTQAQMQALIDAHYSNAANPMYEEIGTTVHGYTNQAFPLVSSANDYLAVTYYDDYNNLPAEFNFSYLAELVILLLPLRSLKAKQ